MPRSFSTLPPAAPTRSPPRPRRRTVLVFGALATMLILPVALLPARPQASASETGAAAVQRGEIAPARLTGSVQKVHDGNTFEVAGLVIRLADMACPPLGTPAGDQAAHSLRSAIARKNVSCDLSAPGPDRIRMGICTTPSGLTIRNLMLRLGECHAPVAQRPSAPDQP